MSIRATVLAAFTSTYHSSPQFLVRAPGRANLIGEHTDYNDGFVMPLAVDRAIWIAVAPRDDQQISVKSLDFGDQQTTFSLDQLTDAELPHWSKHVRGAWWLMQQQGKSVPGANLVIGSDIPMSAGMSSSAAIGVGVIETVLRLLADQSHSQAEKALLAVEIEHQFMKMPCGILDQMASAAALPGTAMLLDCRSLATAPVPLPESVRVVVIDSRAQRPEGGLVNTAYAERRAQCEQAAQFLGIPALRDATMEMVEANREKLGDVLFRRARHIVTEDDRTLAMKKVLEAGDLKTAGELLDASHASLRDDYEVSVRPLDVLSEVASSHPGCYGARIMGGGFGGCAVSLVENDVIDAFIAYVEPHYTQQTGLKPEFYVCVPSSGSRVETL